VTSQCHRGFIFLPNATSVGRTKTTNIFDQILRQKIFEFMTTSKYFVCFSIP